MTVTDSFGDNWPLTVPTDWSLFGTTGLDPSSIVVWATARTPLAGPVLDEVVIGIDEDANLVWAVEQIVAGQTLATPDPATDHRRRCRAILAAQPTFSYLPMTPVPRYWHPYVIDGEATARGGSCRAGPRTCPGRPPACCRRRSAICSTTRAPRRAARCTSSSRRRSRPDGLRVQRRAMLARSVTGEPVLWTQRRREPLLTPPTFALRFDLLRQDQPAP